MTYWPDNRVACIDVETTGTDLATDRIIEIAVVVGEGRKIVSRQSWLIDPGIDIPEGATAVNGITNEMVRMGGKPFADVVIEIDAAVGFAAYPAAYNAPFDRGFVLAEWMRAEAPDTDWLHGAPGWLDPMVWAKEAQKYERSKKLGAVAERLGIPITAIAHRATADAETALQVLYALRRPSAWADWTRRTGQDVKAFFPAAHEACVLAQEAIRKRQDEEFQEWKARQPAQQGAAWCPPAPTARR